MRSLPYSRAAANRTKCWFESRARAEWCTDTALRLRNWSAYASSKIRLVTAVDKVAASGGYLMASVSDHIIAAPFAVVGSIGVVAQIPNVHRLLKKHDVDVEVLTAGKYKRTLTIFGENTEQGRAKFVEELEDVHALFQEFVRANRPQVSIDEIATGEVWYGRRALEHRLVDELSTSDAYLMNACNDADVYEVRWVEHKKPIERLLSQFMLIVRRCSALRLV